VAMIAIGDITDQSGVLLPPHIVEMYSKALRAQFEYESRRYNSRFMPGYSRNKAYFHGVAAAEMVERLAKSLLKGQTP